MDCLIEAAKCLECAESTPEGEYEATIIQNDIAQTYILLDVADSLRVLVSVLENK